LCGPVQMGLAASEGDDNLPSAGEMGHLQARIHLLETEVAQLKATVEKLCSELGLSPPGQE
jgi:uncharacterized protein YceH (UPF0502 family)